MNRYTFRIRVHMDGEADEVEAFAKVAAADLSANDGVVEVWVDKPVEHGEHGRPPTNRLHAEKWLTHYLARAPGPAAPGDIYEAAGRAGIKRRTLRRASEAIGVIKNPPGGGKTRWSLPQGGNDGREDDR